MYDGNHFFVQNDHLSHLISDVHCIKTSRKLCYLFMILISFILNETKTNYDKILMIVNC